MKALVIGGGGFLGKGVTIRLAENGVDVSCLDRIPIIDATTQISHDSGCLKLESMLDREKFDLVYWLSWSGHPRSSNEWPLRHSLRNMGAWLGALDVLAEKFSGRIIFASSFGELGVDRKHGCVGSFYALDKFYFEERIQLYKRIGVAAYRYQIARIGNLFGENQRVDKGLGAIGAIVTAALLGREIQLLPGFKTSRLYQHVDMVSTELASQALSETCKNLLEFNGDWLNFLELLAISSDFIDLPKILGEPVRLPRLSDSLKDTHVYRSMPSIIDAFKQRLFSEGGVIDES